MRAVKVLTCVALVCRLASCASVGSEPSANISDISSSRPAVLDDFLSFYGLGGSTVVYTMRSTPQKTILDGQFVVFGTNGMGV
jgi:hypothetical protein